MKKHKLLFSLGLLLLPFLASAQFYSAGTDPARAKWCQIQAGAYTIIYPFEIGSLARRYAFLFESATPYVMAPLQAKTPSIPVVLHPYNMYSNGMVVWAPKRMELYTTPPASSYAQNWEKQLVLHETRHVGQMSKLSQNFFRVAGYFIGQQSQGIAVGGYMPKWMLEGDAVLSETELSFSGRGREAAFLMPYKAYLLDSISFHWDVWRFGSYKHFIPNDYQFGYYLLSALRYRTRLDILSGLYDTITKRPFIPFISRTAFRKITGTTRMQSWDVATTLMRSVWDQQLIQSGTLTAYRTLTDSVPPPKSHPRDQNRPKKPSAAYAQYESLTALAVDSIYTFYQNLTQSQSLVRIDANGQKSRIRYVGYTNSDLTGGGGKLYWTEIVPDLRWEQESFSILRSYDPGAKKFRSLSTKSRYVHPSVSPSAQQIAVVDAAVWGVSSLHIVSADDGALCSFVPAPEGGQLQSSAWASDSLLYAAVLTDGGLGIYALDVTKGVWNNVVAPQYRTISRLFYADGLLYFSSDVDGTDNIYALDPTSNPPLPFALTRAKYGAFSPYLLHDTLYYANYTYAGLRPVAAHVDHLAWEQASFDTPYESPVAAELSRQAGFRIDTITVPERPHYIAKPYRKAQNIFRFHSWTPIYYDVDNVSALSLDKWYDVASLGATLLSQNTLSTAVTQLGYAYRDGFHSGHLKFIWRGWYPVIEFTGVVNDRNAGQYKVEKSEDDKSESIYTALGNSSLRAAANVYIPFNLRSRGWVRGLIPRVYLSYRNDQYFSPQKEVFQNYWALQTGVQYYQYRQLTLYNIFPRLGFGISVQAAAAPWNHKTFGTEFYGLVYGYVPGLAPNQGLRIKAAWQHHRIESGQYFLSNLAAWPRGYESTGSEQFVCLSADYAIPVWLGDVSLGPVLYLKRLQVIPFFDWAQNRIRQATEQLYSGGVDLLVDCHVLRIGGPISAGVRSLVREDGKAVVQALFSVNIQ